MTYSPEQYEKAREIFRALLINDTEIKALVFKIAHKQRNQKVASLTKADLINRLRTCRPLQFKGKWNCYVGQEVYDAFADFTIFETRTMLENNGLLLKTTIKFHPPKEKTGQVYDFGYRLMDEEIRNLVIQIVDERIREILPKIQNQVICSSPKLFHLNVSLWTKYQHDPSDEVPRLPYREVLVSLLLLESYDIDYYRVNDIKDILVEARLEKIDQYDVMSVLYALGMIEPDDLIGNFQWKTINRMIKKDRSRKVQLPLLKRYQGAIRNNPTRVCQDIEKELKSRGSAESYSLEFQDNPGSRFYWHCQLLSTTDLEQISETLRCR